MSFGERLKQLRINMNYTGKAFSELINVPYQTYMGYENKGVEANYDTLCRIATALHVSIDDLLGHTAPGEHERLIEYARSCGLEVTEENGLVTVRLTEEGMEGLTPGVIKALQRVNLQPVEVPYFDYTVTYIRGLMEERTREQALFEIANALDSTMQIINTVTFTTNNDTKKSPTE